MLTAPGPYSKHAKHAPGAVHIPHGPGAYLTTKFFQIINGLGPYGPGPYSKHAPGAVLIPNMVLEHIWLRKSFRLLMV